jgi:inosine triphosphate pyrophosphatase
MLSGFPTQRATAVCTFAYASSPASPPILFEGRTEGTIVPARGSKKFGWDPIFEPLEGKGQTYAEMDEGEKNKISHRGRAMEKLKEFLAKQD